MSVNKVILVGNVGKDPETRYLDEGTAISKFPMATSETYRNRDGERVSTTEWHNVVLWRGLAQVAEKYVRKGTQLYIEGRIKTRSYDDQDGNKRYITEIVGDQMQLLGRRPDDQGESGVPAAGQAAPSQPQATQTSQSQGTGPQTDQDKGTQGGQDPNQSPAADPGDPFDSGNNGPDDLPF
jgi:single-strand DNA-binding protein